MNDNQVIICYEILHFHPRLSTLSLIYLFTCTICSVFDCRTSIDCRVIHTLPGIARAKQTVRSAVCPKSNHWITGMVSQLQTRSLNHHLQSLRLNEFSWALCLISGNQASQKHEKYSVTVLNSLMSSWSWSCYQVMNAYTAFQRSKSISTSSILT